MSDVTDNGGARHEDEDETTPPRDEGDRHLGVLVRAANAGGLQLGVTLWVSGSIISGVLVGAVEYFEGIAELVESAGQDDMARIWRQSADEFRANVGTEFESAFNAPYGVRYIHLKDANVFTPGVQSATNGFWWRGRIDRVDGYIVGNLSRSG